MLKKIDAKTFGDDTRWRIIEEAIKSLPDVSLKATLHPFDSEKLEKTKEKRGDKGVNDFDGEFEEGSEAIVSVSLSKENSNVPLKVIVHQTSK